MLSAQVTLVAYTEDHCIKESQDKSIFSDNTEIIFTYRPFFALRFNFIPDLTVSLIYHINLIPVMPCYRRVELSLLKFVSYPVSQFGILN